MDKELCEHDQAKTFAAHVEGLDLFRCDLCWNTVVTPKGGWLAFDREMRLADPECTHPGIKSVERFVRGNGPVYRVRCAACWHFLEPVDGWREAVISKAPKSPPKADRSDVRR